MSALNRLLLKRELVAHSQRVTAYATLLAHLLGWRNGEVEQLRTAALLHDLGKCVVPDAILLKPGALTPEERAIVQAHPRVGYEMLVAVYMLENAATVALFHHERWDGTGYPARMPGAKTPIPARVVAVADTLDALTAVRPYRASLSFEQARAVIAAESGRQFDPEIVTAFLTAQPHDWERQATSVVPLHGNWTATQELYGLIERWQAVEMQKGS